MIARLEPVSTPFVVFVGAAEAAADAGAMICLASAEHVATSCKVAARRNKAVVVARPLVGRARRADYDESAWARGGGPPKLDSPDSRADGEQTEQRRPADRCPSPNGRLPLGRLTFGDFREATFNYSPPRASPLSLNICPWLVWPKNDCLQMEAERNKQGRSVSGRKHQTGEGRPWPTNKLQVARDSRAPTCGQSRLIVIQSDLGPAGRHRPIKPVVRPPAAGASVASSN